MNRWLRIGRSLPVALALALCAAGCDQQAGGGLAQVNASALTQDEVLPTGGVCTPTGAHGTHGRYACAVCHVCGGTLQFDPAGLAVAAGKPAPSFDATAKACSNIACHGVPSGTFSYYFPDGNGDPALNTVSYGGGTQTTPSWYTTGGAAGCSACHGNPPTSPMYTWHSGYHGGGNQCELCHPDAVSQNGVAIGLSTATNCGPLKNQPCASLHANGTVDVTAKFSSSCYGCH